MALRLQQANQQAGAVTNKPPPDAMAAKPPHSPLPGRLQEQPAAGAGAWQWCGGGGARRGAWVPEVWLAATRPEQAMSKQGCARPWQQPGPHSIRCPHSDADRMIDL